jgi:anti-sigma B factor antagonist
MAENQDDDPVVFEQTDGLLIARFTGREISSIETIDQLLDALKRKIDATAEKTLLIDFAGIRFLATSAINMLLVVLKRMRMKDGDVYLCGIADPIAQILQLMQIHKLFDIWPTRDEAVKALAKK